MMSMVMVAGLLASIVVMTKLTVLNTLDSSFFMTIRIMMLMMNKLITTMTPPMTMMLS